MIRFYYSRKLLDSDIYTPNTGQTAAIPKREIAFVDTETGQVFKDTDLAARKRKKQLKFSQFRETYKKAFMEKKVSIILVYAPIPRYPKVGHLIKDLKKMLKRKGIITLGYVWCRDIGMKKFVRHYHIMIATERLTSAQYMDVIQKKRERGFKAVLCNSLSKFTSYLTKKDLYAATGEKAFGTSLHFKKCQINML